MNKISRIDAKAPTPSRIIEVVLAIILAPYAAVGVGEQARSFRISAVQEDQVWIEGGVLDGLAEGNEGDIYYEITVLGQKKRIIPAKVRLVKVEDNQSIGILRDQSGTINVGYHAALAPKPINDLLTLFHSRGTEAFLTKDYYLAKQFYQRILEVLPGDLFALQRIKECDAGLEKLAALERERKNVPYYKKAIQALLESKDPEGVKIANTYVEKILALSPGDAEALKFREKLEGMGGPPTKPAETQVAVTSEKDATKTQRLEEVKPLEKPAVAQVVVIPENAKTQRREDTPAQSPPPKPAETQVAVTADEARAKTQKREETRAEVKPPDQPATPAVEANTKQAGTGPTSSTELLKDMAFVPEGEVSIGMDEKTTPFWNETPRQKVRVLAFYIDRYEVTNEDYKKFCDATGRNPPSYFVNGTFPEGWGRRPVVMISWIDADAYARWAGKRLPSELEWETAAAGRESNVWPWGNTWDPSRVNTREGGEKEPAIVGSHPGDVSLFQVYDMAGNVSEWTADWYKPYPGNTHREKEYGQQFKVLRGGSVQVSKEFSRSQFRARLPDGFRSMDLGFRCALSAGK